MQDSMHNVWAAILIDKQEQGPVEGHAWPAMSSPVQHVMCCALLLPLALGTCAAATATGAAAATVSAAAETCPMYIPQLGCVLGTSRHSNSNCGGREGWKAL